MVDQTARARRCTTHHICDCQAARLNAAELVVSIAADLMREVAKHSGVSRSTMLRLTEAVEAYSDTLPEETNG